jgi:hypothetical protein
MAMLIPDLVDSGLVGIEAHKERGVAVDAPAGVVCGENFGPTDFLDQIAVHRGAARLEWCAGRFG